MKLFIQAHNDTAKGFYEKHGHFHDGDAGLDLDGVDFTTGLSG